MQGRVLPTGMGSCEAGGVVEISGLPRMSARSPPQTARALSSDENIWSKEYWAKKGDISLYLFRKRMGDPAVDRVARPILFLAHGSSVSSRPAFDLIVPRHDDYSLMDKFGEYGLERWTVDLGRDWR